MEEEFKVQDYAVVNQTNIVENIVAYNGDTEGNPYNPGIGLRLVGPLGVGEVVGKGYAYHEDTDTFSPPPVIEDPLTTE